MSGEDVSAFPPGSFEPSEFRCVRCGKCCRWKGIVKVTEEEADSIAGYLGMDPRTFIDSLTRLSPDRTTLSLLERRTDPVISTTKKTGAAGSSRSSPVNAVRSLSPGVFPDGKMCARAAV